MEELVIACERFDREPGVGAMVVTGDERAFAAGAPLAVRLGKEAVNNAFDTILADGVADERRAFYFLFSTEDPKKGMPAFIEKRRPEWKGK